MDGYNLFFSHIHVYTFTMKTLGRHDVGDTAKSGSSLQIVSIALPAAIYGYKVGRVGFVRLIFSDYEDKF